MVGAFALASLTAAAATARPHERPADDVTEYVAQLRDAVKLAEQAASSTGRLRASNTRRCSQVEPAAATLAAAADAARAIFDRYRSAKTRYGTREEIELITTLALELREARASLASVAGEARPPSAAEQGAAEREVSLFRQVIAREIEDRLGIEGLADVLTKQGFKGIRDQVVRELHQRVRVRAEAELRRLTGLPIRLNVPLKKQIRDFMEAELSRLISKLVVSAGPGGLVVSLIAGRILNPGKLVDLTIAALEKLLRQKGNVVARANRSLAGLEALRRNLNELSPDTPLDRVRSVVRDAQRELGRTKFLEGDLAREKQDALLAELTAAKKQLERTIKRTRFRFLLDSQLFGDDFGLGVAFANATRADTARLLKKLGCSKTAPPTSGSKAPTAAVCVPKSFPMEFFAGPGTKREFEARFQKLVKTGQFASKCVWVESGTTRAAYAIAIYYTPPDKGLPSGNCEGRFSDNPGFSLNSRKRYLSLVRTFTASTDGIDYDLAVTILERVLATSEAAGVGEKCR